MRAFASTLSAFCSGNAALPELLTALRNDLARDRQALLKNRVLIDEAWRSGHVGDSVYRALRDTISGFDFKASNAQFPPSAATGRSPSAASAGAQERPSAGAPERPPRDPMEHVRSANIDHDAPTKAHSSVHHSDRTGAHSARIQSSSVSHHDRPSAHSVWPEDFTVDVVAGVVLKERFVLEEEIGRGGMGTVFRARDVRKEEAQDRDPYVAVKVLNEDIRRHPTYFKALQREAKKSQALGHPNVAAVFDFDRDGSTVFLVMELLKGQSLRALIDSRPGRGLPQVEALRIVHAAGTALAYAHTKGVIHSDFKPANVIRLFDGTIKVLDFGIARAFTPAQSDAPLTYFDVAALRALTPAYASPEMLLGESPDPRDDVFALGCVAYELLSGRHPFGYAASLSAERSGAKLVPIKRLRRTTWRAMQRALAFSRAERTPSIEEFIKDLEPAKAKVSMLGASLVATAVVAAAGTIYVFETSETPVDDAVSQAVETDPIAALPAEPQAATASPSIATTDADPKASTDRDVSTNKNVSTEKEVRLPAQQPTAVRTQAPSDAANRASAPHSQSAQGLSAVQLKERALSLARADEVPDALTALSEFEAIASSGDPGIREVKIAIAQAYARLAENAFAAGDYSSAAALGMRATEMTPNLEIHQERLRAIQRVASLAEALETSDPLPVERIRDELVKIRASEGPSYYSVRNRLANVLLDRIEDARINAPNKTRKLTEQAQELFAGVPAVNAL